MGSLIFIFEACLHIYISVILLSKKDKQTKFLWMFAGFAFLHPFLSIKIVPNNSFFYCFLVLLDAWRTKSLKQIWNDYPLKGITLCIFLFHLAHPLFYDWQGFGQSLYAEIQEFLRTFAIVFAGFVLCPQKWDWEKAIHVLERMAVLLILIAFSIQILHENYISACFTQSDVFYAFDPEAERSFRNTGTVFSPNIFGIQNVALFLLINHFEKRSLVKRILLPLLLLVIFFTATRAPFVILIISLAVYYALYSKTKMMKILLYGIPIFFIAMDNLPETSMIGKAVNSVIDIFLTGGQNTSGSSVELRESQWEVAAAIGSTAPFFGHGVGFTDNLITETGVIKMAYMGGLFGAEGYQFYLAIDYGLIYSLMAIFFFLSMLHFFMKGYFTQKRSEYAILGFVLTVFEIFFLFSSRPQASWQVTMLFAGLFMKLLCDARHNANNNEIFIQVE